MQRFAPVFAALLLLAPSAHLVAAHSGDDDGDGRSHHQSRRLRVVDTDIVDLEVSNADSSAAIITGDTIIITGRQVPVPLDGRYRCLASPLSHLCVTVSCSAQSTSHTRRGAAWRMQRSCLLHAAAHLVTSEKLPASRIAQWSLQAWDAGKVLPGGTAQPEALLLPSVAGSSMTAAMAHAARAKSPAGTRRTDQWSALDP
jgi:hypothetical protein